MIKKFVERFLIKIINLLKIDLIQHAHVQQGVGHNTYNSGENYVIETAIFDILKKEPYLVFDIGANIGEYVSLISDRFKDCTIHCFEPAPENYSKLISNVNGLNAICHNFALGKEEGILELFKASNNSDGSMITAHKGTIENIFKFAGVINETIACKVDTIDNFCQNNVNNIDFLKIDVEGHELQVLQGATRMIKENKIKIIQFEFNEFNIFSKSFLWDFYNVLPNYDFYRILPKNKLHPLNDYNSINEIFRYQNILAVNKSLNYKYSD